MTIVTLRASSASKNNNVNLVIKSGSPRTTTQAQPPLSMPSSSTVIVSLLIMFSSSVSLLLPSPFSSLSVSEPMIGTLLSSTVISARLTVVERESQFLTILSLSLKQDLFASIECYGDSQVRKHGRLPSRGKRQVLPDSEPSTVITVSCILGRTF